MANSAQVLKQVQQYAGTAGKAPTQITNAVKRAYEGPVRTLVEEGQQLRERAYPAFFNAFDSIGTGAGDMSPSAALGAAVGGAERAMSPYRTNVGMRDYYGTMINDIAGKALQGFQMGQDATSSLYDRLFQREEAARAARARGGMGGGSNMGGLAEMYMQLMSQQDQEAAKNKAFLNSPIGVGIQSTISGPSSSPITSGGVSPGFGNITNLMRYM